MSARVGIIYGSASDHDKMVKAAAILERFGVGFEIEAMSAHRSPDRVHEYATTAEERGVEVIIAGAGMAAHLAGVCAALTPLQRVRYGLGLRKQFELLNDLEVRPKLHCGA